MDEQLVEKFMQIILKAGDARTACMKALDKIEESDFEAAQVQLQEADRMIVEAHHIHTEILQESISGKTIPYSVLFSHAQDTLMTICAELNLAKKMYRIFRAFESRLSVLEKEKK